MSRLAMLLVGAALFGAACSDSGSEAIPTPSAAATAVSQAVCDAQARVVGIVRDIQSGTVDTQQDLASRLAQIQTELQSEASRLESAGQEDVAAQLEALADGVGDLETAVQSQDPDELASAAANLATAAGQVSLCEAST